MHIDRLTLLVVVLAALSPSSDVRGQDPWNMYGPEREVESLFGRRTLGWPVYPKPRDFGGGGMFGPRPNLGRGFQARRPYTFADGIEPVPVVPAEGFWDGLRQALPQGAVAGSEGPQAYGPEGAYPAAAGPAAGAPPEQSEMWFRGPPGGGASQPAYGAPAAPATWARPGYRARSIPLQWLPPETILAERLSRTLKDRLRSPLEVSIQEDTAILRGTVATEHDRKLAGHVARFEPSVRSVQNELVVEGAAESSSEATGSENKAGASSEAN